MTRSTQPTTSGKLTTARRIAKGGIPLDRVAVIPKVALRPNSPRCQCNRCGLVFSTVTAFDKHQTLNDDGSVQCWEPGSIGLALRDGVWGQAGERNRYWD